MFAQITILGTGLLGASIAMAARSRAAARRVQVWSRRAETRAEAAETDWADEVFDEPAAACVGSDLIILCTPVDTIVPLLARVADSIDGDALITDVGSTKSRICREAAGVGRLGAQFLGSHPMAGSEQTGMAHARENLFENAACILTPLEAASGATVSRMGDFWRTLGMTVMCMSPEQHDEAVAHISHLPHFLAATLAGYLARKPEGWKALAGGGLRDSSRIAAGDPTLWGQIFDHNREEVIRAISGLEDELQGFKSALLNRDHVSLHRCLTRAKEYRDQL